MAPPDQTMSQDRSPSNFSTDHEPSCTCDGCRRLGALFGALDPGPAPANLRSRVRDAIEGEPAPVRPSSPWKVAAAAAVVLLGTFLALHQAQGPSQAPGGIEVAETREAARQETSEIDRLVLKKEPQGVRIQWDDGQEEWLVEASTSPDFRQVTLRAAVQGAAWTDAAAAETSRLTFYRVRPLADTLR